MHGSGIQVTPSLVQEWGKIRDDTSIPFAKYRIENDAFVLVKTGAPTTSNFFAAAQAELQPKEPAYMCVREPKSGKWVLVFYVPLNSKVSEKMVLASSYNAFKIGFGSDNFIGELYITDIAECSQREYDASNRTVEKMSIMTRDEILSHEAAYDSHATLDTEAKVSVDLPIKVGDGVTAAVDAVRSGKSASVIFRLNTETETLEVNKQGSWNVDSIGSSLPDDEPSYSLLSLGGNNDKAVFLYYCPIKAKPRQRMFYSAAKSLVIKVVEQGKFEKIFNLEASDLSSISTSALPSAATSSADGSSVQSSEVATITRAPAPKAGGARKLGKFSDF